jgi:hypothetical protein
MKQKSDMENRLESALNSLDGIRRASPAPYFFTRLKAKMTREERDWGGIVGIISRPLYALAIVGIVIFINSWIVFRDTGDTLPSTAFINGTANTNELPEEYNVAVTTFYNYDTP